MAILQIIYNRLLDYDNSDFVVTTPIEGGAVRHADGLAGAMDPPV